MKMVYDTGAKRSTPSRSRSRALAVLGVLVTSVVAGSAMWLITVLPGGDSAPALAVAVLPVLVISYLGFVGLRRLLPLRLATTNGWDQREAATAVLAFGIAGALVIGVVYADLAMMVVALLASLGPRYSLRQSADRKPAKRPA